MQRKHGRVYPVQIGGIERGLLPIERESKKGVDRSTSRGGRNDPAPNIDVKNTIQGARWVQRSLLEQENAHQECDGWENIEWKDRRIECSTSSKELMDKGTEAPAG